MAKIALTLEQKIKLSQMQRLTIQMMTLRGQDLVEFLHEKVTENPLLDIRYPDVRPKAGGGAEKPIDNIRSSGDSLEEKLMKELRVQAVSKKVMLAAGLVIQSLDEKGFFAAATDEFIRGYRIYRVGRKILTADAVNRHALPGLYRLVVFSISVGPPLREGNIRTDRHFDARNLGEGPRRIGSRRRRRFHDFQQGLACHGYGAHLVPIGQHALNGTLGHCAGRDRRAQAAAVDDSSVDIRPLCGRRHAGLPQDGVGDKVT